MLWNDLVRALSVCGDTKTICLLILVVMYPSVLQLVRLFKPIVDSWMKERETFMFEVSKARESIATLANNHVTHLQISLEEAHERFLCTQKEIVDMQRMSNQTAQETVKALERLQDTNIAGFSEIRQSMSQLSRDVIQNRAHEATND